MDDWRSAVATIRESLPELRPWLAADEKAQVHDRLMGLFYALDTYCLAYVAGPANARDGLEQARRAVLACLGMAPDRGHDLEWQRMDALHGLARVEQTFARSARPE